MTWAIQENSLGWQGIEEYSTTAQHPLGTVVRAYDPTYGAGEFVYLRGGANVVANSLVTLDNTAANAVALTETSGVVDAGGPVMVAKAATTASRYGWFQTGGNALALKTATKVNPASTFKVYLGATAGRVLAGTSTAGRQVLGARFVAAATVTTTTSTAVIFLNRAFVGTAV